MELTQILRRNALCMPSAIALVHDGESFTWREFANRTARLAGGFAALGVKAGDRVAMLADNSHRYLEFYFAAPMIGAVFVPLNHRLSDSELTAIMLDAECHFLLTDRIFADRARAIFAAAGCEGPIIFADTTPSPDGTIDYETLLLSSEPVPDTGAGGDDLAGIFYTGGTTGAPKGVMHSHDNLVSSALSYVAIVGLDTDSVSLCSAPLFHVSALTAAVPVLLAGGRCVVLPRFDPDKVIAAFATNEITVANFVPTMLTVLLDRARETGADLSSVRTLLYGAAPMPPPLLDNVRAAMPHARIRHAYGMTELTGCLTILPWIYNSAEMRGHPRWRSAGHPLLAAEVRVVDEQDQEVPPGTIGEICGRGPLMMKGYWRQPELTAKTIRNGWMHTGDAGYLDEDGFLFVVDRLKDMIITGGENVYCTEVEAAIATAPGVHQCAVFGIPHPLWGETVHAVIEPDEGAVVDLALVEAHVRARIAGYKVPRSMEIRTEAMPLSGANKILKNILKAEALARRDAATLAGDLRNVTA